MTPAFEIVGGEQLAGGDLARLQPLAERVFGPARRGPRWFARKLEREGVLPELCALARAPDGSLLGYALLGRLSSRARVARGAGIGVLEHARGQGVGRALVEAACQRAAEQGCEAVEFLAEDRALGWYARAGFTAQQREHCLAAPGLGPDPRLAELAREHPGFGPRAAWSWAPESWTRTPRGARLFVQLEGLKLWLTREGRAWLALRAELESPHEPRALLDALDELRRRLPRSAALLLYPIADDSPLLRELLARGFELAQSSTIVRRATPLMGRVSGLEPARQDR